MTEVTAGNKMLPIPTDFVELGKKQIQCWAEAQSEIAGVISATNKGWVSRAASRVAAGREFANKLSSARSAPDLVTLWHEWAIKQYEAAVDDNRQALSEGQKLAEAAARLFANSWAKH